MALTKVDQKLFTGLDVTEELHYYQKQQTGGIVFRTSGLPSDDEVVADGSILLKEDYPELWDFASNSVNLGAGDGQYEDISATEFRVPDLVSGGEFIRAGIGVGTWQSDDIKSHNHTYGYRAGSYTSPGSQPSGSAGGSSRTGSTHSTGGDETRPRNITYLPCIKIGKVIT